MGYDSGRDLDAAREALARWLSQRLGTVVTVEHATVPTSTGFSHDTVLVDVRAGGDERSLVAMIAPSGDGVFMRPDVGREFGVIEAVARAGVVPVAQPIGYEPDPAVLGAPFYVVERVDGLPPPDNPPYTFGGWLYDASPDERARVWWSGVDAMIGVHLLDPAGLRDLTPHPGVAHELAETARYLAWATEGDPPPALADALAWLRANAPADPERVALCWGDARLANQLFRDGVCVAVLDWEMAGLGDPQMDLGWWLYFDRLFSDGLGMPRLSGFPSREETIARYEQRTGRPVKDLAFYEVLAGLRFAAILGRLLRLRARLGEYPLGAGAERDNFAIAFCARVLEEARA